MDGTEATESISFTINANSYEIDLNETNATAFRAAFQPYIDSAQHNTQQATTDSQAIRECR
ncbi:histone-like nucleoid-structuring protein Lsr2 [Glutamicibacter sp. NPDC127525]|uniref:Lsr2 dimerization domain-containing protein n=1 Tax=Glutamicibacter sp. NPDC127525 TaxID=3345392 RepID=UPI003637408C